MEYTTQWNDAACTLALQGRLTFEDHEGFSTMLDLVASSPIRELNLELRDLTFIDSAGLGIILLLREETQKRTIEFTLRNPRLQVKSMFELSKFYDFLYIEETATP